MKAKGNIYYSGANNTVNIPFSFHSLVLRSPKNTEREGQQHQTIKLLLQKKRLLPDLHLQSWVMEKEDGLAISSNSPGAIKCVCCDEGRKIPDSTTVSGSLL